MKAGADIQFCKNKKQNLPLIAGLILRKRWIHIP